MRRRMRHGGRASLGEFMDGCKNGVQDEVYELLAGEEVVWKVFFLVDKLGELIIKLIDAVPVGDAERGELSPVPGVELSGAKKRIGEIMCETRGFVKDALNGSLAGQRSCGQGGAESPTATLRIDFDRLDALVNLASAIGERGVEENP